MAGAAGATAAAASAGATSTAASAGATVAGRPRPPSAPPPGAVWPCIAASNGRPPAAAVGVPATAAAAAAARQGGAGGGGAAPGRRAFASPRLGLTRRGLRAVHRRSRGRGGGTGRRLRAMEGGGGGAPPPPVAAAVAAATHRRVRAGSRSVKTFQPSQDHHDPGMAGRSLLRHDAAAVSLGSSAKCVASAESGFFPTEVDLVALELPRSTDMACFVNLGLVTHVREARIRPRIIKRFVRSLLVDRACRRGAIVGDPPHRTMMPPHHAP